MCVLYVCCCMQKTAYVWRISDWSSDVCSSALGRRELVVRAGVHLVADLGAVLGHIVVVRRDRTGAEVDVTADRRVTDVGQMRHLAALADSGVLRLDERADLAALGQVGSRTQVRERADGRARADHRERRLGASAVARRVGQAGVSTLRYRW